MHASHLLPMLQSAQQLRIGDATQQLQRSASTPGKDQWTERPRKLINQKHQLLPRTQMDILRYGEPAIGPLGTKNIKEVSAAFPFRGYIEGCENRGVTLGQMTKIRAYAGTKVKDWKISVLTHCHIDTWLGRPVTKEHNSALVEHLAKKQQQPSWFISHFWGQPVTEFFECVSTYLNVRRVGSDTVLWVCAYAYRPNGQQSELATRATFTKAIQSARFRVLLVLDSMADATGPATPFSRLWCAFECSLCLEQACTPIDVAAYHQGKAEVITRDFLQHEVIMDNQFPGKGTKAKIAREKTFPFSLVEEALQINIKDAQATIPSDRSRLLNSIIGGAEAESPPEEHPTYDVTNKRLRSLLALTFFHRALKEKRPAAEAPRKRLEKLLKTLAESIRGDEWRKSLGISVAGCLFSEEPNAEVVVRALPPNLLDLTLDLRHTGATDGQLEVLGAGLPRTVQTFALDLTGCELITNQGLYALGQALPRAMRKLTLKLTGTKVTAEMVESCATSPEQALASIRNPYRPRLDTDPDTQKLDRKAALEAMLRMNKREPVGGFRMDDDTKRKVLDRLGLKKDPRDVFLEKYGKNMVEE